MLLAGIFFVAITLTGIRALIVNSIPHALKCGIAAGIGLFITLIGLDTGGLVVWPLQERWFASATAGWAGDSDC